MWLGPYQLDIATDFGPRITSLRLEGGPEQFVRLGPDVGLDHEDGRYEFKGGHRLWAAPEIPGVTYASDDHRCDIVESDGVVTVTAPPDSAGLIKEIDVQAEGDVLVVEHRMTRATDPPLMVAPWAITQLPLGGTAILPSDGVSTGLSANRYVVLWPYTSIEDRRLTLCDEAVEIEARDGPQIKLGVGPSPGRLGYFQDGTVFIKDIESARNRDVPEFGAAGQVYVGQGFCELESVGGLTNLSKGDRAVLRERWRVVGCSDLDEAIALTVAR